MTALEDAALRARLAALTPARRTRLLGVLGQDELTALTRGWGVWAHDGQAPPPGDWRTWVLMAGRGFGKTRAGAEWVRSVVRATPGARIALVAASLEEARRLMIDGPSGLQAVAAPEIDRFLTDRLTLRFHNGAEATLFSGASPDRLRGPEHHAAWCDELAKWVKPGETWDMLQLGLRAGDHPRALVTTTPRPGAVLERIMAAPGTVLTRGATRANPHLPPAFVEAMYAQYQGTRLGRQELDGELLTDIEHALWTVELLERCRLQLLPGTGRGTMRSMVEGPPAQPADCVRRPSVSLRLPPPRAGEEQYTRLTLGVDPPSGPGTCGIIACARDTQGRAHVLADHSVTDRPPEAWARAVVAAAQAHATPALGPPLVVAERNQGGEMVRAVLRAAAADLPVKLVHATEGKSARAEPVHALFEAGRVHLHGRFPELEAELRGLKSGGGYERVAWTGAGGPGRSPDRADAMVWALTELMLGDRTAEPRVCSF